MKFLVLLSMVCQTSYYTTQQGPKCSVGYENEAYFRYDDIKKLEPFVYWDCDTGHGNNENNQFGNCKTKLSNGCNVHLDGMTLIRNNKDCKSVLKQINTKVCEK